MDGEPVIDTDRTKIESFDTEQKDEIRTICLVDEFSAWIVYEADCHLLLIDTQGKTIKKVKADYQVLDLNMIRNGDILVTPWGGGFLSVMSKDTDEIIQWKQFFPCTVNGVLALSNDNIVVSLQHSTDHRLVVVSTSGHLLKTIEHDKDGSKLFHLPCKMTSLPDDSILVSCYSKIVAVDSKGNHEFTMKDFFGEKMSAYDVSCDHEGRVFVTDRAAGKLYVMDKDGKKVQCVLQSKDGLTHPNGLAVGRYRRVWVGNGDGKILILNY